MDDHQLSQLVRAVYPVRPMSDDLASIERRALQLSSRRRIRRVVTGAAALMLAVGGVVVWSGDDRPGLRPADSTPPQSTTLTTEPPVVGTSTTTATPTTPPASSPPPTAGIPLLGAALQPGTVPRFISVDPAWTFSAFTETAGGGAIDRDTLVLVGDGPLWDAPRLVVEVGPSSFDREDSSTTGTIHEFDIGGQHGRYREASPAHGGFEFTWDLPGGTEVAAASTGLTSDEAVALLSLVTFEGTKATIDAPPGFSAVADTPPSDGPTSQVYEFTGDDSLFYVECWEGTSLLTGSLARQPTESVAVAGTEVGLRLSSRDAGPTSATPLSMSIFKVGDWYCQTILAPPMVAGATFPSNEWATEDEIRTLLASLILVGDGVFRDIVAPLPESQIGGFSVT